MKCPVCDNVRMREVVKDEVLIDVCPECKGVWLDRGELEKLMQGVKAVRQDYERMEQQIQGDFTPYDNSAPQRQQAPEYNQPQAGYGMSQPSNQGYPSGQGKYHDKQGYDKYGRPYKKKKTVLDVFGDLFD